MDEKGQQKLNIPNQKLFGVILFFILMALIFSFFVGNIKVNNYETFYAQVDVYEFSQALKGIPIWREIFVYSEYEGSVVIEKEEGKRTYKGENILSLAHSNQEEKLKRLQLIEEALQYAKDHPGQRMASNFEGTYKESHEDWLRIYLSEGKFKEAKEVYLALNQSNQAVQKNQDYTEAQLIQMKEEIWRELNMEDQHYNAPDSGVVSYVIYEDGNVTASEMEKNSPDFLCNLTKSLQKNTYKTGDLVAAHKPMCRIINNYEWYLYFSLDEKTYDQLKEGKSIYIRLAGEETYEEKAQIHRLYQKGDCRYCIVALSNYGDFFIGANEIDAQLIFEKKKGIKIFRSALHQWENEYGVYVQDKSRSLWFKPVTIIMEAEDFVVVNQEKPESMKNKAYRTIRIYDDIIKDADKVASGDAIFPKEKTDD